MTNKNSWSSWKPRPTPRELPVYTIHLKQKTNVIKPARYFVYLLECADGSLYTGITTDVKRRLTEHKRGVGSSYTRARGAKRVVYTERQPDRSLAQMRESEIKRLSRAKKLDLLK